MAQAFKNTFIEGLDLDTSIHKYPNTRYIGCENFRIVTKDGLATGALEIIEGNRQALQLPLGQVLVGVSRLRNELILFAVDYSGSYVGTEICFIYKVSIDDVLAPGVTTIGSGYYFESSGNLIYKEQLGFTNESDVRCITSYENSEIQKLYFITSTHPLRQLNIVNSTSNNLKTLPVDALSVLSQFDADPTLQLSINSGGNMKAGSVQYFLQFYRKNGSDSSIYAHQELAYITNVNGRGSSLGDYCNRSVTVSFNYDGTNYNRFRLLAADYETLSDTPNVRIVAEQELYAGSISVTDYGQSSGTVTAEEIAVVKTEFSAETIEAKDNYLLLGNVSEEYFDITDTEFDARAYRFNSSRVAELASRPSNTGWLTMTLDGTNPDWDSVPSDYDAINRFNWNVFDWNSGQGTNNYSTYPYYYKADGVTLGGEGKYISYEFITEDGQLLDSTSSAKITNPITNYKGARCFQRSEVYRFGIVFYDKKGRQSFVKWICDARMPFIGQGYSPVTYTTSGNLITPKNLYIQFRVDLPTSVKDKISGYKIVRVDRGTVNRSILGAGIISPTVTKSSGDYYMGTLAYRSDESNREYLSFGTVKDYFSTNLGHIDGTASDNVINKVLVEFVSPEINFNKNLELSEDDNLSVENTINNVVQLRESSTNNSEFLYTKYRGFKGTITSTNRMVRKVDDLKIVSPANYNDSIDKLAGYNYLAHMRDAIDEDQGAKSGTRLLCNIAGNFIGMNSSTYTTNPEYMYSYYRRRNDAQYGGGKYDSRLSQEYIECSDFVVVDDSYVSTDWRICRGGDTFITMFEYLRGVGDEKHGSSNRAQEVVYFPVESSINTQLKSNRFQSVLSDKDDYNITSDFYLLQETEAEGLAAYPRDGGELYGYPEDATDLYQYNSAYSVSPNVKKYYSEPFDFTAITDYDARVIISQKKTNNEYTDSWSQFSTNDFLDLDGRYGKLVRLINYKNNIIYFQERGYGVLSINQRSLIQDNNPGALALGTGGVLERFDYLDTDIGIHGYDALVLSNTILYFIGDDNQFYIMSGRDGIPASKAKNIRSFLNSRATITKVRMSYDELNDEILITLIGMKQKPTDVSEINTTLCYNEIMQAFNGFYTYVPTRYIGNKIHGSVSDTNSDIIYLHDSETKVNFFGTQSDALIKLLINPNNELVNTFDNFEITSQNLNNGVETDVPLTSMKLSNSIQDSGEIPFVAGTNIVQKWRTWGVTIPRVTEGTRKNRMTDTHLIAEFKFTPTDESRFILHDLTTYFRTPIIRR